MAQFPIIDLHCDLLDYMVNVPGANPELPDDIGCSLPMLRQGGVKLQTMAIYTATGSGSSVSGLKQSEVFKKITEEGVFKAIGSVQDLDDLWANPQAIGAIAAVENASGFCEEGDDLSAGIARFEKIIENCGRVLYLSLTHHLENRFGGGNSTEIGLKDDGKTILDFISGKQIALDFSHTSDRLAYDALDYIEKKSLKIPIMASHSNLRRVYPHERNLPDTLAREIIAREGLIGINFVRAFINEEEPDAMYSHIFRGLELGGTSSMAFGADFFYFKDMPDPLREPYYHAAHQDASKYQGILLGLQSFGLAPAALKSLGHGNALRFMKSLLG